MKDHRLDARLRVAVDVSLDLLAPEAIFDEGARRLVARVEAG